MLLFTGKITGISGIVGGQFSPQRGVVSWRGLFVAGLLVGGVIMAAASPESFANTAGRSAGVVAIAGLLVGFGTRLGNGCTSGHGVCGISRMSNRSLVSTGSFIAAGALSVLLFRHLAGGM
jgi:uncharacterized membrane protein YedE/YeeE